ncbi:uncharacterized protein CCOS01_09203 [Colletotrichum costaricense]|uniref:Uncharacterized protein n=1 Tax=Colletotrichum costaricense TaxID=1209916 RepID=A0AAJ0DZW3_9PEZI|nr:uncharacterized protein CCOS01_09203 [Colletotrichum costaricense]KAK1524116.1 hypothetical protein CCOS01_09203 [Colletotrichum costaricense]
MSEPPRHLSTPFSTVVYPPAPRLLGLSLDQRDRFVALRQAANPIARETHAAFMRVRFPNGAHARSDVVCLGPFGSTLIETEAAASYLIDKIEIIDLMAAMISVSLLLNG